MARHLHSLNLSPFHHSQEDDLRLVPGASILTPQAQSYCSLLFGVRNTALSRAWPQLVRRMASKKHGTSRKSDDSLGGATQQDAS
jgi:hypothetical protein